jgi:hypothetical protein
VGLKEFVKVLMSEVQLFVLWDLAEDVVVLQLFLVASEELLVECEGTAWLAVDLEVSHLLASVVELLGVLDTDHGGTELSGDVSLDLRLGIKDNLGFVSKSDGNLVAGDSLWQVVQVDKLLWVHVECFFVFFVYKCRVCLFFWVDEYVNGVFCFVFEL